MWPKSESLAIKDLAIKQLIGVNSFLSISKTFIKLQLQNTTNCNCKWLLFIQAHGVIFQHLLSTNEGF